MAIRILTRFGVLHEEEVFVLGLRNGIRREVSGRVATIGTNRRHVFAAVDANVGAKGIVDEAAARSIVGKLVGIRNCGRKSAPTLIEELRILERTVVGVVGAARVAHVDIGVKGNAVEFGTVTIAANRTSDVRTVGVVHAKFKLTAGRNLVTGLVGAGILGVLRITVARGTVGLIFYLNCVEAVALKIGMILKKRTGVHDTNSDVLAGEAESIGLRGIHGCKTPVLLVFGRFKGTLGFSNRGAADVGIRILVGGLGSRCHHEGGDGNGDGALGGLALRGVVFVRNDVLLMGSTPLGLENAIHFA